MQIACTKPDASQRPSFEFERSNSGADVKEFLTNVTLNYILHASI